MTDTKPDAEAGPTTSTSLESGEHTLHTLVSASHGLEGLVRPDRLPADSLLLGQTPHHDAR